MYKHKKLKTDVFEVQNLKKKKVNCTYLSKDLYRFPIFLWILTKKKKICFFQEQSIKHF